MFERLSSFLSAQGNKQPRYRLYDTWEPEFDSELNLAVSSFYADEAFHEVFGRGQRIPENELKWHFISFILRERYNPIRHIVTVRRDRELKAIATGTLYCGQSNIPKLIKAIKNSEVPTISKIVAEEKSHDTRHAHLANAHFAKRNDSLEQRIHKYYTALSRNIELSCPTPIVFKVNMIAVDPGEQGKGHVRAMLDRIVKTFRDVQLVERIEVSTYDKSKKELYMHLGFVVADEAIMDDMRAWRLTLPLR